MKDTTKVILFALACGLAAFAGGFISYLIHP